MKRPIEVTSESASHVRIFPRGIALTRKIKAMGELLNLIAKHAEAECGICEAPLLAHWGYCPSCGQAIDWEG